MGPVREESAKPADPAPASAPRRRRRWPKILFGSLAGLALLLALAPTILSMGFLRARVAAGLSDSLRRKVEVASVSFGWTTGARLEGLVIYEKDGTTPFARLESAEAKVSLLPLLSGTIALEHARASGLEARVTRRADGTLSTDDLGKKPGEPAPEKPAAPRASGGRGRFRMGEVALRGGAFRYTDERTGDSIEATDLDLCAAPGPGPDDVTGSLSLRLNGGDVRAKATLGLGGEDPAYDLSCTGTGVRYHVLLARLVALVNPALYADREGQVKASMGWELSAKGRGFGIEKAKATLAGRGKLSLERGSLVGNALVRELFSVLRLPGKTRYEFEGVTMSFRIEGGRVVNEWSDFGGRDGVADLSIAGWTDLDGNLKQTLTVKGDPRARWGKTTGAALEILNKAGGIPLGGTVSSPKLDVDYEKALLGAARGLLESPEVREAAKDLAGEAADALGGLLGKKKKR
ncbi:MAG: AsmA family protein [Planctomycetales bacterium]|nr:AsmA family protein [Planctomycetales bacterium]